MKRDVKLELSIQGCQDAAAELPLGKNVKSKGSALREKCKTKI